MGCEEQLYSTVGGGGELLWKNTFEYFFTGLIFMRSTNEWLYNERWKKYARYDILYDEYVIFGYPKSRYLISHQPRIVPNRLEPMDLYAQKKKTPENSSMKFSN